MHCTLISQWVFIHALSACWIYHVPIFFHINLLVGITGHEHKSLWELKQPLDLPKLPKWDQFLYKINANEAIDRLQNRRGQGQHVLVSEHFSYVWDSFDWVLSRATYESFPASWSTNSTVHFLKSGTSWYKVTTNCKWALFGWGLLIYFRAWSKWLSWEYMDWQPWYP